MKKQLQILKNKIKLHSNNYWLPIENSYLTNTINSHSWFNINEKQSIISNNIVESKTKLNNDNTITYSRKIKFFPSKMQKTLLLNWMKCYILMYNETIKYFKTQHYKKLKSSLDFKNVRTYILKDIRNSIINESQLSSIKENTKVNTHVLDSAIHDACTSYKSCLTNLRNNNIKHFRLRYLKHTKPTKIIKIEKNFISNKLNTFCPTIFKEEFDTGKFKLKDIKSDFIIQHESKTNSFYFIVPKNKQTQKKNNISDTVGIDIGIKTFATCFSNNKISEIGQNIKSKLITSLKKIDNINNNNLLSEAKQKKIEHKYNTKIKNKIDDLHWKSINYLTNNFKTIKIGNVSTFLYHCAQ